MTCGFTCPSRLLTSVKGTPAESKWELCVSRGVWRLAPVGSLRLRNNKDTESETVSGFSGEPSELQKM